VSEYKLIECIECGEEDTVKTDSMCFKEKKCSQCLLAEMKTGG